LYNISGESIIRQFAYGMKELRRHFPGAEFSSYSSEEPCFTSALPQILKSYGIKYASLKNPNTCWGGYTRAFGGQLVNWIGPDGSSVATVPRYAVEKLKPGSTWETIASFNSKEYISAALQDGINNPAGMCLQDAGWRNGRWLGDGGGAYQPTTYETWRSYFANHTDPTKATNWKFSQEDVLVSLVWGAQVVQRVAQDVRVAENKIVAAEKVAALAGIYNHTTWPQQALDDAWKSLLLAQHHDCWIVPYNNHKGKSWAQWVAEWTSNTNQIADSIVTASTRSININVIKVFNTAAFDRKEIVAVKLSQSQLKENVTIEDAKGKPLPVQLQNDSLLFVANVPAAGYNTFTLISKKAVTGKGALINKLSNGKYLLQTDLYTLLINPAKGGIVESLVAKQMSNKEFVGKTMERSFNEIKGYFYNDNVFHSSTDHPATVEVLENGPLRIKVAIHGTIAGVDFTQWLSLAQGEKRIDAKVKIDWKENVGIGAYSEKGTYKNENVKKAFYNDSFKLLVSFPVSMTNQNVYKDAPFDVLKSSLSNTFFNSWDSIKNNVILHWVDVTDAKDEYGLALFTDHTTSYAHGKDFPLSLNLQYSGMGLFGPDYGIDGPTEVNYSIIPHKGRWDKAGLTDESVKLNEQLVVGGGDVNDIKRSFVNFANKGWELTSVTNEGNDLVIRVFNAYGNDEANVLTFDGNFSRAELIELNGDVKQALVIKHIGGKTQITFQMPRFGIRTVRLR
jgi:alpha-mannosidase